MKRYLTERFRELSSRKEYQIVARNCEIMVEHVHMVIPISLNRFLFF